MSLLRLSSGTDSEIVLKIRVDIARPGDVFLSFENTLQRHPESPRDAGVAGAGHPFDGELSRLPTGAT
ncbi:MAG: hypothetical protein SH807_00395 [Blastochloris sp.]|nr:hypothetical protein [Blastochloris sp.]